MVVVISWTDSCIEAMFINNRWERDTEFHSILSSSGFRSLSRRKRIKPPPSIDSPDIWRRVEEVSRKKVSTLAKEKKRGSAVFYERNSRSPHDSIPWFRFSYRPAVITLEFTPTLTFDEDTVLFQTNSHALIERYWSWNKVPRIEW